MQRPNYGANYEKYNQVKVLCLLLLLLLMHERECLAFELFHK